MPLTPIPLPIADGPVVPPDNTPDPAPPLSNPLPGTPGVPATITRKVLFTWQQDRNRLFTMVGGSRLYDWGDSSWVGPWDTGLMAIVGGEAQVCQVKRLTMTRQDVLVALLRQSDGTALDDPDYDAAVNGDRSWWLARSEDGGRTWSAEEIVSDLLNAEFSGGVALTSIGDVIFLVFIVEDAPRFITTQDFGQTWE